MCLWKRVEQMSCIEDSCVRVRVRVGVRIRVGVRVRVAAVQGGAAMKAKGLVRFMVGWLK